MLLDHAVGMIWDESCVVTKDDRSAEGAMVKDWLVD